MAGVRRRPNGKARGSRFGVYLRPGARKRLLARARRERRSATAIVEELIEQYIATTLKPKSIKTKRGTRRTSPTR